MEQKEFFIPSVVGLHDLQPIPLTVHDHVWHEIESISLTEDEATIHIEARDFLFMFVKAHANGWHIGDVFKSKGML